MAEERTSARPLGEMDKASRERLEAIMAVDPNAVTDGDRAFLNARRDYLTADQRADYGITGEAGTAEAGSVEGNEKPAKTAAKRAAKKVVRARR